MAVFFTADTHFGDRHILRQRGTRFATIEAHDAALIERWNAVVTPEDEIWHLGDFAGEIDRAACADLFGRLNGRKRLVRGNHDTNRILELPWAEPPIDALRLTARDADGREHKLFLSHYPHRSWPGIWRETRHLTATRMPSSPTLVAPATSASTPGILRRSAWMLCFSARMRLMSGPKSSHISPLPKRNAE